MTDQTIDIVNVRQHNLKGFDLSIPLGKITVLTGPSGSGKSTLALDVLFAEGQYRYLESLGMAVKRIVDLWDRPLVDAIKGLPPPIAFEQKPFVRSPRSSVATLTSIADFMRLFFATCGRPYCPKCQIEIRALSIDQMADRILDLPEGTKLILMAPITRRMDLISLDEILNHLKRDGFLRIRIDGKQFTLDAPVTLEKQPNSLELVVDRLILKPGILSRLVDSLTLALSQGEGSVTIEILPAKKGKRPEIHTFSEKMTCPKCQESFPALSPQIFSCSHPDGMCFSCKGKGKNKSGQPCPECGGTGLNPFARSVRIGDRAFPDLMTWSVHKAYIWLLSFSMGFSEKFHNIKNIQAGIRIVEAILSRLKPLEEMGLGYIELNRPATTLSGGEIQRLRLGAQLGRELTGILYILDEPTIGLHPREQQALWQNLIHLRDQGNTIIVVEHDLDIIRKADNVIELGPGAADEGGYLVFSGTAENMAKDQNSITGPYLQGKRRLKRHGHKRKIHGQVIICNAQKNNLRDITVAFPLGCLVCVTGVSGSGKSTLVTDELYHALRCEPGEGSSKKTKLILKGGLSNIPETILVDQTPLTKARFSMPATYMGIFTHIRAVFSRVPEARGRGYKAGYFSLTRKGGRCERCKGQGSIDLDLQYLPSIKINCDLCRGMRYNREALGIRYKGLNMAEVLDMTIKDAADFFARIPRIRRPLEVIERIGLGYLKLGQPACTLSGGEAQRLKLTRELAKQAHDSTIYIMDEPSRGLHPRDLERFISVLDELLEQGHSVILIENQPEILDLADWIIELGPGGGPDGGNIVAKGPPAAANRLHLCRTELF
ncbi:MAG: ATP-binding cassette domain-containing protein [Deltaproteobacteria bacterium]|nr:ATP-binding cassette domain-containing protein [Deltaproteobacteria bacterium]MDL1960584.1 ATP-binding cassette domain-containing protein [Deltaproteobacteria bacterium]